MDRSFTFYEGGRDDFDATMGFLPALDDICLEFIDADQFFLPLDLEDFFCGSWTTKLTKAALVFTQCFEAPEALVGLEHVENGAPALDVIFNSAVHPYLSKTTIILKIDANMPETELGDFSARAYLESVFPVRPDHTTLETDVACQMREVTERVILEWKMIGWM